VAEDVVQDVMIDLWERRATIVVRGTLRSYLFGAVRRRIADHQRHDGVVERHAAQQLPVVTVSSEHILDADELERATAAALATLSARSRAILEFRWHSGLSYSEIADALGVSEEAAKKQGRRAELVVRALLARFAPPD
jgi:RNA polymerase sigma-70 factor (ECF subfamily)